MIKKLRIKLIATSMVSLFLVLFVIGGIVSIINHKKIVKDADRILDILEENDGTFPRMEPREKTDDPHGMSAEIPYESRYFSVLYDANGTIILTDTSKIASVDTETAVNYASKVWNKKSEVIAISTTQIKEASVMSVRAGKYNTKLHKYEDVLLPDECRTYEEDMEKMVPCAQCGRLHKYGEMYTSREVHTAYGFGFAVCRECYDDEMDRFLAEHPPFKEN